MLGWKFIRPENHVPFIPENTGVFGEFGWSGILKGAGIVFFAFIGFDAVSTAAQEAKEPQKGMPIGILGSLVVCTFLYVLFSYVLTGVANYKDFWSGWCRSRSICSVCNYYLHARVFLVKCNDYCSNFGRFLFGDFGNAFRPITCFLYSMSKDGLLPAVFSDLHPKFKTPFKSNALLFLFVGVFAAFVPGDTVGNMTSIGTLFAFVLVCAGIIIMRKTDPDTPRPFKTPLVPLVPILGILVCAAIIYGLGVENWVRLFVWLGLGFVIYFGYSVKKSKLNK